MEEHGNKDKKRGRGEIHESPSSIERYVRMSEREKDLEIQKAVTRLQNRISEILYLLETETKAKITDLKKEEHKAKQEKRERSG